MTEVWKTIRDECGKLSICTYKDTGCSDCIVNQTFNKIENALEKQIAKKPIDKLMYIECPACENIEIDDCSYCPNCGQKLDWSEV